MFFIPRKFSRGVIFATLHRFMYQHSPRNYREINRFHALFYTALFFFVIIAGRLAWLQIIHADDYKNLAEEQNARGVVLPAKRGNIYTKDYRTNELFPLAQNSTTYTIFADPLLIESGSESALAEMLLPFLWVEVADELEEAAEAEESEEEKDSESGEESGEIKKDLKAEFRNKLVTKLATKDVIHRELHQISEEERKLVADSHLPGVGIQNEVLIINPTLIDDPEDIATKLATILADDYDEIYPLMIRKKIRYTKLAAKVTPSVKDEVVELGIRGIGAIPEYRRVYPEGELASQVIGFLDHDEKGVYGVEGALDKKLRGKDGLRKTQVDPFNRQITVGDVLIENAEDGNSLVLTIDRAVQETVERELGKVVEYQRADSGQAIVMDPHTGAILALAHHPKFNPNAYGDVYEIEELIKKEKEKKWVDAEGNVHEEVEEWWETADEEKTYTEWGTEYVIREGYRYPVFTEYRDGEEFRKSIYANRLGEGVFTLKAATDPYEPGSVFKSLVMAAALDAGEVEPLTRSPYNGPVELDELNYRTKKPITIKNAQGKYHGQETMTEVIEHSSNIGMTFIAQALGRATFYDYLKKFGFGERCEVEFEGEDAGTIENYTKWSDSELITKAFGQGLTVNLFQMAVGYSALANGGLLMKPHIIDEEILPDGRRIKAEPETIRRVIDEETSRVITQMLVSSVKNGYAKPGGVEGYFVAGKTGTSQTYLRGKALSDLGTTITAFGGYAPATDPKFVLIVKVDRPRISEWGAAVAAPIFQKISEELLKNYFAIPPSS
jgi:stage V sporulation protein D (sporulation-specific penicillin-binding protein)